MANNNTNKIRGSLACAQLPLTIRNSIGDCYIEKEEPQPHVVVALGLFITNIEPSRLSL